MKRLLTVLMVSLVMAAVSASGVLAQESKKADAAKELPAKIKVKLPDGTVMDAYRMPSTKAPSTELILKGVVKAEEDVRHRTTVIVTETGKKFVLFNPPFVNTLLSSGMGKEVTIKGKEFAKTNFKDYPGIWISDIVEIKK